jgi:hypothetical protein
MRFQQGTRSVFVHEFLAIRCMFRLKATLKIPMGKAFGEHSRSPTAASPVVRHYERTGRESITFSLSWRCGWPPVTLEIMILT